MSLAYTNDTEAEVKLVLPPAEGNDLPTEIAVKPGETVNFTDEQAKFFLQYDLQAKKVDTDETVDTNTDDNTDGASEEKVAKEEVAEKLEEAEESEATEESDDEDESAEPSEVDKKLAEERTAFAEEKRKFAEEKAEMAFAKLCESGKAVPAQKEAFMALATREEQITLHEGKTESVSKLLETLFESAPQHSLMEESGESGEGEEEPELTDEESRVADVFGNSEEDIKNVKKEEEK